MTKLIIHKVAKISNYGISLETINPNSPRKNIEYSHKRQIAITLSFRKLLQKEFKSINNRPIMFCNQTFHPFTLIK